MTRRSLLVGLFLFDEQLHDSTTVSAVAIVALVIAAVGLYVLVLSQKAPAPAEAPLASAG